MSDGYHMWFMDETTVHPWSRSNRVWQHQNDPFYHMLPKVNKKNVTVIGAIGKEARQHFKFIIAPKTATKHVHTFFVKLRPFIKNPEKTCIIMDNHTAHRSHKVQDYLQKMGVRVIFTAPGASSINPIENVWSVLKNLWRRKMTKLSVKGQQHDLEFFSEKLDKILNSITNSNIGRLVEGKTHEMYRFYLQNQDILKKKD